MLDEKLLKQRLEQFNPEPLIDYDLKSEEVLEIPSVKEDEDVIDLAKVNYLNMLNNDELKKTSEDIIRKYGVGTCGPRAFYGTTDIHLEVEEFIAKFLELEECIVYSYGFVAISSSIAAYCKRNDVVFVDEHANFPIQQGLASARSKVVKFKHNDPEDLYQKVKEVCGKEKKPARKFLILEAVSWKTGKLCPLEDFLKVAEEFKMRVFLEESYSMGVLGKHGRGLTEYLNIDRSRVDMIIATLEGAIGSIGGFCAGTNVTIEHQRLSGSGYIFSASLPTYLAKVAVRSIELMGDKPQKLVKLAQEVHTFLKETCKFEVLSDPQCPFQLFSTPDNKTIHKFCEDKGLHFILRDEGLCLHLNVNLYDNKERLEKVYSILKEASELC